MFQIGKGLGESAAPILAAIVNPAAGVAVGAIDVGLQAAGGTALNAIAKGATDEEAARKAVLAAIVSGGGAGAGLGAENGTI